MIQDKLNQDIHQALRDGDRESLSVLRLLKNSLNAADKSKGDLSDDDAVRVLQKEAKQRQDSIASFEQGDRPDLADKEKQELAVIERYLPEQMDGAELEQLIDKAIAETGAETSADIGKVMGVVTKRADGRADNGRIAGVVRSKLS